MHREQPADLGHALRVTMDYTRSYPNTGGWFTPPATHSAANSSTIAAVEGQRYRIIAGTPKPAGMSASDNLIWNTLAKYGAFCADNGGTWFINVDQDPFWDNYNFLNVQLAGSKFEVINTGPWINENGSSSGAFIASNT